MAYNLVIEVTKKSTKLSECLVLSIAKDVHDHYGEICKNIENHPIRPK